MIWIVITLVMIFLLIYFTTVKIQIEYKRAKENDHVHIQAGIWFGLIRLKFNIPLLQLQSLIKGVRVEENVTSSTPKDPEIQKRKFRFTPKEFYRYLKRFYQLRDQVLDLNRIVKQTLKKIRCEQFEWYTRVGVGDAASTGILTGVIWGIKTTFIGIFSQYVTLRTTPRMNVIPAFQGQHLDTQFFCIVRFRIGNAIIAGIRILFKFKKGREGIWQNTLFRA